MFEALQEFTTSLPVWARWAGIILISALPFVESYFGSVIGIVAGVHPVVAIPAAILGNVLSMLALVYGAHKIRSRATAKKPADSPKKARLRKAFDRWGVPGVSLLGQTVLPSQITSMAMVSFGASRNAVARWQIVSIIAWGVLFGGLAMAGVQLLG
ncbi:hypothetical protein [Brevibacterium luteolum]|uniref:Small multidrug efflux protein n=1 Tax=Brevibacterium luteolum TaxID=199591 RepID=A0A6G8KWX7_9MICO|nr:hypothetical protein [Brevibacterium luteolum]QIN29298.1 hypothetical protein EW640_08435 [Brevibacterium luteolum]